MGSRAGLGRAAVGLPESGPTAAGQLRCAIPGMDHGTRPWQALIDQRMMRSHAIRFMLRQLATLLLLSPVALLPAQAHQIESALNYLDGTLELTSSFSNGEPAEGAVVRLLNPDGSTGSFKYRHFLRH